MPRTEYRQAGRVAAISPGHSILLLSGFDPDLLASPPFWFLPGGGAEKGETPEQAARREFYEEVGARLTDLGPPVWRRRAEFVFAGHRYEQEEWIFVVLTPLFIPKPTALTELELRTTTGARWWSLARLAGSSAPADRPVVYPPRLGTLVQDWLRHGPPAAPLLVD